MAVKDEFIETVSESKDPADTWQALKNIFEAGNSSQILLLSTKLHNMRMVKGGSIEEYLQTSRDLKSNLVATGHNIVDETLVQLTLNGFPLSYEGIIQSLIVVDKLPTFAMISSKLLSESHCLELRKNRLGEEDTLHTHFQENHTHSRYQNSDYDMYRNHNIQISNNYSTGAQFRGNSRGYQREPFHTNQRKNFRCYVCGSPDDPARLCRNKNTAHK